MAREVIREFENFTLEHITGVGNNDTPYEQLNVRSKGLAEKHVVEVRLDYRVAMSTTVSLLSLGTAMLT